MFLSKAIKAMVGRPSGQRLLVPSAASSPHVGLSLDKRLKPTGASVGPHSEDVMDQVVS